MGHEHRVASRPGRIRDDRGQARTIRPPRGAGVMRTGLSAGQELWRDYARVVRNGRSWIYHMVISGTCVGLAAGAASAALSGPSHQTMYGVVAVGLIAVAVVNPIAIRRRRSKLAGQLAWFSECLACAYPLDELEPDPDGCTVCPECGAAWRIGVQPSDTA
ncbi:MAG: hypothetical protein LAT64_00810 [Phycisphaerales bacterium]|nr:hypothetical protein [Planctomycetota bacterium]MCH8507302.1 hypothetical protein [Phycisphaerales bacterium]